MALAAVETKGHILARSFWFIFPCQLIVKEPTGVVDRGHLDSTGGQRGLGLEPIPFKCRHRCEEMVLVPSVLLGQTGKLAVTKTHTWILYTDHLNRGGA